MTIILCDDDVNDLQVLRACINRFGEEHQAEIKVIEINDLRHISQIEEILEKQQVEAVFLDIDMPYMTGNAAAQQLIEKYPNQCIIFFTNREEMVYDVIQYKPFRFIKKQNPKEINEVMQILLQQSIQEGQVVIEKGKAEIVMIPAKDIVYVEAGNRQLLYHTTQECIPARGSIVKAAKELDKYGFIQIHAGYLVNILYIKRIYKRQVSLADDTSIPIGGKYKESVMINYKMMVERIRYGQ